MKSARKDPLTLEKTLSFMANPSNFNGIKYFNQQIKTISIPFLINTTQNAKRDTSALVYPLAVFPGVGIDTNIKG
jgi:hypothetical protein